jgi:hypothetical protein
MIALTPEDCEVYARAQESEGRAHIEAAVRSVEHAERCHLAAMSWRMQAERLRFQNVGPLDHESDAREPHPNAEAAGDVAC